MRKPVGKALYVFLCTIMGMVLFAVLHRALVVIYYILLNSNVQRFSFGANEGTLQAVDFFTLLLALFLGGWYGTSLGLHWYKLVYEEREWTGLFHGFVPHHWRDHQPTGKVDSVTAKTTHVKSSSKTTGFEALTSMKAVREPSTWDFDDLKAVESDSAPKRKPRAVAKPRARKLAAPKTAVRRARVKVTETE